ncbi:MAG: cytochrome c biogenesis protein CcsA [Deltaproteobacteria bacterium]|nr:cytochrome c biogenesis protein CcsA [Deltaproteobacteria bacterium]
MNILIALFVVAFLGFAEYRGLFIAPADGMMGDVYRILFVHVPAAWMALLFFTLSFVGSVAYLIRKKEKWDRFAYCAAEIGLLMNGLALLLGSLWGRPTWGVWWTWDPRLTTTALLFVMYSGYLVLRQLISDPERRAKVAASVGFLIFLNVPLVYLSVKWWRSLHQVQSSPNTMAPSMVVSLRLSAFAFLAMCLALLFFRLRLAKREALLEERLALPPERKKELL